MEVRFGRFAEEGVDWSGISVALPIRTFFAGVPGLDEALRFFTGMMTN